MYLLGLSIIDQIFLGSINTFDFTNNLDIGIRATLIGFEAINFFFFVFLGFLFFLCFSVLFSAFVLCLTGKL